MNPWQARTISDSQSSEMHRHQSPSGSLYPNTSGTPAPCDALDLFRHVPLLPDRDAARSAVYLSIFLQKSRVRPHVPGGYVNPPEWLPEIHTCDKPHIALPRAHQTWFRASAPARGRPTQTCPQPEP